MLSQTLYENPLFSKVCPYVWPIQIIYYYNIYDDVEYGPNIPDYDGSQTDYYAYYRNYQSNTPGPA